MARRILLACLACFWFQFIFSQSMSDDQVVRYVMEQQEKGKDQQYIVSQLLQKGVTVDQLRRIRNKYEAEQKQPGALDLTGTTQAKSGTSRLRTNKEKTLDERQKRNGYMIRSQREIKDGEDKTLKNQQLNEEIGFMDIDSLIYYRNYFKEDDRQVFGRNIFNNEMLTFEPSMNIPTPANYRLGAGDAVIIDVWGASQTTFEGTVSPDGTVTIEGVGPLTLAGMTVKEANDYVTICFYGIFFICGYNAISAILRGYGDSRRPMYFVALSCVLNIAGDIIFVKYLKLGVAGTALATVLSQSISMICSIVYLNRKKFIFTFTLKNLRIDRDRLKELAMVGIPISSQECMVRLSFLYLTSVTNRLGVNAAAAVGIASKYDVFAMLPATSIASALAAITAQNYGAGKA
mgnify:CR=1 FL=1